MVDLFVNAMKRAGKNPTAAKVYDAMLTIKKDPAAYMSGGAGGFAKGKPYFANTVHLETLVAASPDTAKDANGLFNGRPAPVNCWVLQLVNGQEWFPIVNKKL